MSTSSSSISDEQKPVMSIKAVVDKVKKKVIYVESDQDFVDVLLSFLTLPIGTIIRLMEKASNNSQSSPPSTVIMRCMNNLYKSVQNLDAKEHLETEECKTMLLFPRRSSESRCLNLKLKIDSEKEPTGYYTCDVHSDRISYSKRSLCDCTSSITGKARHNPFRIKNGDIKVFVKKGKYIIDDHMNIQTASSLDTVTSLLDICGITDWKRIEERTLNIGLDEVLRLLKSTLLSHEPLTDMILRKGKTLEAIVVKTESKDKIQHPRVQETVSKATDNKVTVTVVVRKSNNQVLYAIAKSDFIDLLFSFLTFPIGSIVKLCGRSSSILCIDNLYKSVENLSIEGQIGLEEALLVSPKLKAHFGNEKNKLLRVEEEEPRFLVGKKNSNISAWLKLMNPKCADRKETIGGGFIKDSSTFMVTNDLVVTPLCLTSGLFLLKQLNVPLNDVEVRTVSIGEHEALNLLKASLVTDIALSSIISPHFLTPKKQVD